MSYLSPKLILVSLAFLTSSLTAYAQTAPIVDLIWEADSYLPAFYPGHSRPAPGSTVRLAALAHFTDPATGRSLGPESLTYTWSKNGQTMAGVSGLGKDSIIFSATEQAIFRVAVSYPASGVSAASQVSISPQPALIKLYYEEPLLGTAYHQPVATTFEMPEGEINLRAEPFYFSKNAYLNKKIQFQWTINGENIVSDAADPGLITIAKPETGVGENAFTVTAKNLANVLQTATNKFTIKFNSSNISF